MTAAMVLALTAAAGWGAADYVGGVTGRRASAVSVAFASQFVGLVALMALTPLAPAPLEAADVAWGAGAGLGAAVGVSLLFRGLAVGQMSVVAPVTAGVAACLPVLFGIVTGDRPGATALAGVVVALAAVALLCVFPGDGAGADGEPRPGGRRAGLVTGLGSGVGFGTYFVLLDHAGDDAGLWPLLGSRGASVAALGATVLLTRNALAPSGVGREVLLIGALDVVANVSYLLATRRGLLSIVALLASLYPAVTVLLARVLLQERLSPAQVVGMVAAGGAIVLIALG